MTAEDELRDALRDLLESVKPPVSQNYVAERAGYDPTDLSRRLTGERELRAEHARDIKNTLRKIAEEIREKAMENQRFNLAFGRKEQEEQAKR